MGTFILLAFIGVVIGVLSGLLGVGGGTIVIPMLRLAFGLSPVQSTATSLFTIIPTSASGAVTHIRKKTCVPKLGLAMGIGGACTSPLGAWLSTLSPSWAVMVAAALAIGYASFTMMKKALDMRPRTAAASNPQASAEGALEIPVFSRRELMKAAGIGMITGVASGYIGLGGGFLMIPLMVSVLGFPMKLASGTSLIAIMILAIPGAIMQGSLGNVDFLAGIALACGSIPGATIGARLVKYVPERLLRFIFSAFLAIAAILLVAKELGLLGA